MADNDFGLSSNAAAAPVSKEAAVATIDKVAGAKPDFGVAQADGKPVDQEGLREEFDLSGAETKAEAGEAETETELDTELEDEGAIEGSDEHKDAQAKQAAEAKKVAEAKKDAEGKEGADAKKDADAAAEGAEELESVETWMKDVDPATRQTILDQFVIDNIDDLTVPVTQAGKEVPMTIAQLKRAAAGYAGETQVTAKVKGMKADIERREKALKDREGFIAKQFKDPGDLMTFLDGQVEDPVKYFTAVKAHAESVLTEAEDNPARFSRDAALRRENASLRSDIKDIKDMISGKNASGTPDGDATEGADADEKTVTEGVRRREMVVEAGFKVDAIAKAWADDDEPADFDRWFVKYALKTRKDTSTRARASTDKKRRRGGKSLRRRGPAKPKPDTASSGSGVMGAVEIDQFLRGHPSNKGRYRP